MISKMLSTLLLTMVIFFSFGCTNPLSERVGAEIQVVPITYTYLVTVKKDDEKAAWEELDQYVKKNWQKFSTQKFRFTWYSSVGNRLAEDFQKELLSRGISRRQLIILKASMMDDFLMDLKFEITVNRVVTEVCEYEKVGSYGRNKESCFSESVRWKSMVNPEKMLTAASQP